MPGSKKTKRSVPTLTEVVHLSAPQVALAIDRELLVENLLQRVAPTVEHQLREILQRQLQEQMRLLLPQLQLEMESFVRQTVAQAMAEKGQFDT